MQTLESTNQAGQEDARRLAAKLDWLQDELMSAAKEALILGGKGIRRRLVLTSCKLDRLLAEAMP